MKIPDWIELQIRDAERQGAFENLPGKGKPIPDIDVPRDELSWLTGYLKRENVDVGIMLPPSLALAREVERLPGILREERTEARVREIVGDLNARIRLAILRPQEGPPMRVVQLDIDKVVAEWAQVRLQITTERLARIEAQQAADETARQAAARARRAWWRRWRTQDQPAPNP
ncbi:MAG: hypothetical protein JWN61_3262 [Pseudonocardiales bacterium]|nr:hypothetical protein [Pseudonocardiales bacterium]